MYRPPWIARAAVATALVLIAGAGGVAVWQVRGSGLAPVVATTPAATSMSPPPAEPSTPTSEQRESVSTTLAAEPSPNWGLPVESAVAPVPPPDYDAQFVAALQDAGWNVWNPADVVPHAHTVCAALRNGDTVPSINQQMVTAGLLYPREAVSFTEAAMRTYPNCP